MQAIAARARIEEVRRQMETQQRTNAAEVARTIWSLGDYDRFAKQFVWDWGPLLVEACGISRGQRVLDVATGTGNVAIRAAEAGAQVVALDITPESLAAGRREAESLGFEVEWVEGDAQELPFGDDEFDVVTSSAGAIFAPDHQAVADELLRVCRPGGTIAMINFRPERVSGAIFELFGRFAPPPPVGAEAPILWGDEDHVRALFGDRASLKLTPTTYVETLSGTPRDYVDFYGETFGPIIAIRGSLAEDPERTAELDRELLDFATRWNRGTEEAVEYEYDILLVLAQPS